MILVAVPDRSSDKELEVGSTGGITSGFAKNLSQSRLAFSPSELLGRKHWAMFI